MPHTGRARRQRDAYRAVGLHTCMLVGVLEEPPAPAGKPLIALCVLVDYVRAHVGKLNQRLELRVLEDHTVQDGRAPAGPVVQGGGGAAA